jgi:hypothetical protein
MNFSTWLARNASRIPVAPQGRQRVNLAVALVASLLAAAVAGATPSIAPLPRWLSETGYGAPEMQSFTPRYPLWSDGASKRRWIRLPAGRRSTRRRPTRGTFRPERSCGRSSRSTARSRRD